MTIRNALYAISITIEPDQKRASGVIGLRDGWIVGGDSYFHYPGSYLCEAGKWKGELNTHQHTEAAGSTCCLAAAKSVADFPAHTMERIP